MEVLDLLINVLKEHEERLSELIGELRDLVRELKN